jgi:hypothetical protein
MTIGYDERAGMKFAYTKCVAECAGVDFGEFAVAAAVVNAVDEEEEL